MIDTDPVYEQIKYAKADPAARAYIDAHTHFFTYGENLGSATTARCRCAGCRGARPGRRSISICGPNRADGGRRLLHDDRDLGKQGQEHRVRRRQLSLVEACQFPAVSRFAAAPAADLFPDGDAAAGRRRCAARSRGRLEPRRSAPDLGRYGALPAISSPARAASSRWPRTSMSGRTAAGSATARLLPRRRPAGRDDAHRVQQVLPGRARPVRISTQDEALAAIDAIRRLPRAQPRRAGTRRRIFRRRSRYRAADGGGGL